MHKFYEQFTKDLHENHLLNVLYSNRGSYNTSIYKLKSIQQLPCFNAIDIIKAFTNAGFEIVVDNGDLTILNYKEV